MSSLNHFSAAAAIAAAAILALSSCATMSLPTAAEAGLRFDTKAEAIPADVEWTHIGQAHELINIKELVVVVSGGANPMSDADWEKYHPPLPWMKNIERNLLFTDTFFIRSPGAPENAAGAQRYTVREISDHTWIELAQPVAVDFVPAGQKTDIVKPAPGHLAIKTIRKPQILRFTGSIYLLADDRGNCYVMHATETGTPSLNAVLPPGWTLKKLELSEPLIVAPSQGGYYNIVGDCLGQGYHQYIFADATYPATAAPTGLNDCPAELWNTLDAKALAKEAGVTMVKLNGPRCWVMDGITGSGQSMTGEKATFGGIEMALRGRLHTSVWQGSIGDRFYTPNTVHRDTVYLCMAGQMVYELVSDKGDVWRMQSYTQIADPSLGIEDLPDLGARLRLPAGWTYRTRVLDAESRMSSTNGVAHVINDDLFNTYQTVDP